MSLYTTLFMELMHFYRCVTKDNILRYSGLTLHSVVFIPHEDAFDKDVVQFLKSRERTLK